MIFCKFIDDIKQQYEQQEKLNNLFNVYSNNYGLSYMGPNTVKCQISSPVPDDIGMHYYHNVYSIKRFI